MHHPTERITHTMAFVTPVVVFIVVAIAVNGDKEHSDFCLLFVKKEKEKRKENILIQYMEI